MRRVNRSMALRNLEFRQLDLRQLDAREEFDFAYSFDVLEHIAENRQVLAKHLPRADAQRISSAPHPVAGTRNAC